MYKYLEIISKYIFSSIANLKCTPSDRQMYPRSGTPGLADKVLTLSELACDIFVPRFQPTNSSFLLPYQHHSSSADCDKKLFNGEIPKRPDAKSVN